MDRLARGRTELAAGRWNQVPIVLDDVDLDVDGFELLAEARWWLRDHAGAVAAWRDALREARERRDVARSVRLTSWIAREYAAVGNHEAAEGWLARAERLDGGSLTEGRGWLVLARSACASDVAVQRRFADEALSLARRVGDVDLEILALARAGLARIGAGDVGDGLQHVDEALAAATSGQAARLRTVGEVCCDLVLATELTGDVQRFARWMSVVKDFAERRRYPAILGFCSTCCAELEAAEGDFVGAEQQLRAAVLSLHETGHSGRCVPPAAKLADLLILQGRLEEAENLIDGDDSSEALLAGARLALARNDGPAARLAAERAARRLGGDALVQVAAFAALVDAHLLCDDLGSAAAAAHKLADLAATTGSSRASALAAIAAGRVAGRTGDAQAAIASLERALDELAGVHGSIEGAHAHLELARLHEQSDPAIARAEARAALRAFESMAAQRGADAAAALLRSLGDRSRVGPKGLDLLTQREWEVLRLVGQGLTNAEIAERLYISVKTAGNHVSSILTKLQLRSRVEAATYATLHPQRP